MSEDMNSAYHLRETLMIELAWCHHANLSVSQTADRIFSLVTCRHDFWGAGEPDCPPEIKARNGELWKLRCKVCGQDNPKSAICIPVAS